MVAGVEYSSSTEKFSLFCRVPALTACSDLSRAKRADLVCIGNPIHYKTLRRVGGGLLKQPS